MSSVCEIFSKNEKKDADQNEIQSTNRVDASRAFSRMSKEIFSNLSDKWFVSARYCRGIFTFTFNSKLSNFVIQLNSGRDALPYWLRRIKGHEIDSNDIDYDMDNTELGSWTYSYKGDYFEDCLSNDSFDYWDKCGPIVDNAEYFRLWGIDATFLSLYEGIHESIPLDPSARFSKYQHDNGCTKPTIYISDDLYMYINSPFFF